MAIDVNLNITEGTHTDGSPLGNACVDSEEYINLAVCPYKDCDSYGRFFKCYQPESFIKCKTYLSKKLKLNIPISL